MNGEAKDFGGFPKRNLQACAKDVSPGTVDEIIQIKIEK